MSKGYMMNERVCWTYNHLLSPLYNCIAGKSLEQRVKSISYVSFSTRDFIKEFAVKKIDLRDGLERNIEDANNDIADKPK